MDKIRKRVLMLSNLPLKKTAKNLVFGKGNPDAKLLLIGEAPGAQEDAQGLPFVGTAGKKLDGLLHSIKLNLDSVYICNILKYRPPKNRPPNAYEIKAHTPFLIEQIKTIQPTVIVTLGNFATKFVLAGFDTTGMSKVAGITKIHGKAKTVNLDAHPLTVIPLFHPAAVFYNYRLKKILESDFKKIARHL